MCPSFQGLVNWCRRHKDAVTTMAKRKKPIEKKEPIEPVSPSPECPHTHDHSHEHDHAKPATEVYRIHSDGSAERTEK